MSKGQSVTVTIRKLSTGHRVCALAMDDLNHAYSVAMILVRSQEYSGCYAVGTDWQSNVLFNVQPDAVVSAPAPYVAPTPPQQQYLPPQPVASQVRPQPPQVVSVRALPSRYSNAPRPAVQARPQVIVDAEIEEDYVQPVQYRALPSGR